MKKIPKFKGSFSSLQKIEGLPDLKLMSY